MEVEFRNVTITVGGVQTAAEAYDALCAKLGAGDDLVEWQTDTYVVHDGKKKRPSASTAKLFPKDTKEAELPIHRYRVTRSRKS